MIMMAGDNIRACFKKGCVKPFSLVNISVTLVYRQYHLPTIIVFVLSDLDLVNPLYCSGVHIHV